MQRSKYELFQSYFPFVTFIYAERMKPISTVALFPTCASLAQFVLATNQDMRFCRGMNFFKPLFLHFFYITAHPHQKLITLMSANSLRFENEKHQIFLCNLSRKFTFPYQLIRFKPYQKFVASAMYIIQVARDTLVRCWSHLATSNLSRISIECRSIVHVLYSPPFQIEQI